MPPRTLHFVRVEQLRRSGLPLVSGWTGGACPWPMDAIARQTEVTAHPLQLDKKSSAFLPSWLRSSRRSYLPVPFRFEICGLLLALSVTASSPVLVPVWVGVKVTLTIHFSLAARLVVHVVAETAKSPVVDIARLVRVMVWLL